MTLLAPFLPSLTTSQPIQRIGDRWTTLKKYDIPPLLDEHLAGGRSIGLRGAEQIQYLMIDIDCHNGEPIQASLDILLNAFPGSSLPFRSSDSNGIHFYIFLDEMTPREKAREALRNKLISIDYPDAGRVEIFPWSSRGHRLPFGIENRPMPGGKDTLADTPKADRERVFTRWHHKEMRPFSVSELLTYTNTHPVEQTANKQRVRAQNTGQDKAPTNTEQLCGRAFYSDPVYGIDTLLSQGITSQGMRHQACKALTFYHIANKGLSKAETVRKITAWIDEKHNGQSACYNRDQAKAYQEIMNIVRTFDSSKLHPEKAHKSTPQNTVKPIQFANAEQRQFSQVIQRIGHKFGRKTDSGEIMAGIAYELIMKDFRFSSRNKVARCFKWAKASGLLRTIKTGFPGLGGSVYIISPALLYGRHGKPNIDKRQKLVDLVQEHGTQTAVAELLGVSPNVIYKVLNGKMAIPKAWFEPVQVSRITQIDTLLSFNLFAVPVAFKKELLTRLSISESQNPIIKSEPVGVIRGKPTGLLISNAVRAEKKDRRTWQTPS